MAYGFNPEIIDDKGEGDGLMGMSSKARSKRCQTVAVVSKVIF